MKFLKTVERGAALLDKELGPDWVDKIDLNTLELSSTCNCILGQLYKAEAPRSRTGTRYWNMAGKLGIQDRCGSLGFSLGPVRSFEKLNREWRRFIGARRAAKLVAQG